MAQTVDTSTWHKSGSLPSFLKELSTISYKAGGKMIAPVVDIMPQLEVFHDYLKKCEKKWSF